MKKQFNRFANNDAANSVERKHQIRRQLEGRQLNIPAPIANPADWYAGLSPSEVQQANLLQQFWTSVTYAGDGHRLNEDSFQRQLMAASPRVREVINKMANYLEAGKPAPFAKEVSPAQKILADGLDPLVTRNVANATATLRVKEGLDRRMGNAEALAKLEVESLAKPTLRNYLYSSAVRTGQRDAIERYQKDGNVERLQDDVADAGAGNHLDPSFGHYELPEKGSLRDTLENAAIEHDHGD